MRKNLWRKNNPVKYGARNKIQAIIRKHRKYFTKLGRRMISAIILTLTAVSTFVVYAAFIEPTVAPGASNQDFLQNILGADNADNAFSSVNVVADNDGSIIERLEYIASLLNLPAQANVGDYEAQKNQIWDDWKGSASSQATLADAWANGQDQNSEEATWETYTDTNLNGALVASGEVKKDTRTGVYWSNCYDTTSGGGSCDTIANSFVLNGVIADTDDGLDAEGGAAVDFCEALSLDSNGDGTDETDWYLPGQKELLQAYIDGAGNNIPEPARYYWSSTETSASSGSAWYVFLHTGYTNGNPKTTLSYARCARR